MRARIEANGTNRRAIGALFSFEGRRFVDPMLIFFSL
jgi:hypothetical protein